MNKYIEYKFSLMINKNIPTEGKLNSLETLVSLASSWPFIFQTGRTI